MSLDLMPEIVKLFAGLQASVDDVRAEVSALRAEQRAKPPAPSAPSAPRQSFSVEEVAEMLGRGSYSVREWCRLGRINAVKREERRGSSAIWSISAEEVARYRDEGLLPLDPCRNI